RIAACPSPTGTAAPSPEAPSPASTGDESRPSSSLSSHRVTGRWKWLLLLSTAEILTMLAFGTYSAALPVLRQQWALSAAQAGAIFAGQQIGYTAAVLVLSTLTDAAGVRMIYLLSAISYAVFCLKKKIDDIIRD